MERENLMRYVDGEMSAAERSAFEVCMEEDETLRRGVEQERALRQLLQGAYAPVMEEPVPDRLKAALAPKVVSLDEARVRRSRMPTWAALGGMAASVVLGVLIGHRLLAPTPGGNLVASGELAQLLDTKLSGEKLGAATAGLSFTAKGGGYCRSFSTGDSAGVACRDDAGWRVRQLAPLAGQPGEGSQYRTAATAMPPTVLQAVDDMREGDVLDARQEAEAKAKGWR